MKYKGAQGGQRGEIVPENPQIPLIESRRDKPMHVIDLSTEKSILHQG